MLATFHKCQGSRHFRNSIEPWSWYFPEWVEESPLNYLDKAVYSQLMGGKRNHFVHKSLLTSASNAAMTDFAENMAPIMFPEDSPPQSFYSQYW